MINEYERKQYLRERAQRRAAAELDAFTVVGELEATVDWDSELVKLNVRAAETDDGA